jgi:cobalamin biosynthetic protein CobC
LAVAGAQAAIQLIPMLRPKGNAAVLGPTYNEHAAALRAHGWNVCEVDHLEDLAGADIAIVVNPNNPDGRVYSRPRLLDLVGRVGCLVVDESFVDPTPEVSVAAEAGRPGLIVLRSFGKFYGLAGFRLGFVIGHDADVARLGELAGPWSVSGPALEIGSIALADAAWAAAARQRLAAGVPRLDAMAARAGWTLVGGTALFRLYDCADAPTAQHRLAQHRIWSRIFPWSQHFVRLGLPGGDDEWSRVAAAFDDLAE